MSGQEQHAEHESFIKTPRQLIWLVALGFIVPIVVALLLANFVSSGKRTGAGSAAMTPEAIEARIRPVAGFELKGAGGPKVLASGADVYKVQCAACHDAGAAGAPKLGDTAAWAARIKTGYDALLNSALKGKGAMAAQGGGQYDDVEIARAVVHMANAAGAKFAEPKAPAADAKAEAKADGKAAAPAAAPAPMSASPVEGSAAKPAEAKADAKGATMAAAAAAPVAAAASGAALEKGKAIYNQGCMACHGAGVAGAPKFGDKAAWAPRIKTGIDAMTASVIKGKGAMPARGGVASASDADLRASVEYMVAAAK